MANFQFKDKSVCATYFNIARDNLFRTFNEIMDRTTGRLSNQESQLDNYLKTFLQAIIRETKEKKEKKGKEFKLEDYLQNKKLLYYIKDYVLVDTTDKTKASGIADDAMELLIKKLLFKHFPFMGPVMNKVVEENVSDNYDYKKNNGIKLRKRKSNVKGEDAINHDNSLIECLTVLYIFALTLSDCRNFYTHYNPFNSHKELEIMYARQELVSMYLQNVFLVSTRINKNNQHLESREVEFLEKYGTYKEGKINHEFYFSIAGESYISFSQGSGYTQKVYAIEHATESQWNFNSNSNANALSDFGIFYLCQLFISRQDAFLMMNQCNLFGNWGKNEKNKPQTSKKSTTKVDFNLWKECGYDSKLYNERIHERNQIKQAEPKHDEDTQLTPKQISEINFIKEMFCIYRIRIPKGKRMDMYDTKSIVALDILNELSRCPNELYKLLPHDGQKEFQDKVKDKLHDDDTDYFERVRYNDRFPYLAMRAIDEQKILPTIRFQIALGNYRFRFYDKMCIDDRSQLRILQKSINGFGRLREMEEMRKREWGMGENAEKQEENKLQFKKYRLEVIEDGTILDLQKSVADDKIGNIPYITDVRAHYNIFNNRIGLYWEKEENQDKDKSQDILIFPKLAINPNNGKSKANVEQTAPKCLLSVRDLPALLFLYHLNKDKVENVIKNKYNALVMLFNEIKQNGKTNIELHTDQKVIHWKVDGKRYTLNLCEIPDKLRKYLGDNNIKKSSEGFVNKVKYAKNQIFDERLKKIDILLKDYDNSCSRIALDNRNGKRGFRRISHAEQAEYIVKSIMDWLPENAEARKILTGLNYNKLLSFLSLYDGLVGLHDKENLKRILENAKVLVSHPFLQEVVKYKDKANNIESLYKLYLEKEKEHLKKFVENEDKRTITVDNYNKLPFIHEGRERWKENGDNDEYYKSLANRFLEETIMLPDGVFTDAICEVLKNDDRNVSFLIAEYYKKNGDGDESQPFYFTNEDKYKREYAFLTKLIDQKIGSTTEKAHVFLTVEEIKQKIKEYKKKYPKDHPKRPSLIKIENTERTIRRFKTQDMVLFLTAKKMLEKDVKEHESYEQNNETVKNMKLKNMFMEKDQDNEHNNFLSLAGNISFPYPVKVGEKGSQINYIIKIKQDNLSLKNYGKLRRLLNDTNTRGRLYTLLYRLAMWDKENNPNPTLEMEVKYSDITADFAQFNILRPKVFNSIQELEKEGHRVLELTDPENFKKLEGILEEKEAFVLKLGKKLQMMMTDDEKKRNLKGDYKSALKHDDPDEQCRELGMVAYNNMGNTQNKKAEDWPDEIWEEYDKVSIADKTTNFRSLVSLLYNKDAEVILTELRNSFAHGSYDGAKELESKGHNVPKIAEAMSKMIEDQKAKGKKQQQNPNKEN